MLPTVDSCLQNISKFRLAPSIARVRVFIELFAWSLSALLKFWTIQLSNRVQHTGFVRLWAITRIFLAAVHISCWQLSKKGLCIEDCIGTASSTSSLERKGRLGLGRILTDCNGETFFIAENSMSNVTQINSITISLSSWRVSRFRKIMI